MRIVGLSVFALLVVAAGSAYSADLPDLASALGLDGQEIEAPRFSSGDVDGDGAQELVVAGRLGPFRAVTDYFDSKRARMDVLAWRGDRLVRLWSGPNLHVLNDVAAGDLDGDGRAEIVAIGDYWIYVYRWEHGQATLLWSCMFAQGRALRVDAADLDADGRAELLIAEQVPRFDRDVSPTDLTAYAFDGQSLLPLWTVSSDGHVGDLALTRGLEDETFLFFEEGCEEEGGVIATYRLTGTAATLLDRELLAPGGERVLSLSAETDQAGRRLLAVGSVSGEIGIFCFDGASFSLADHFPQAEFGALGGGLLLRDLSGDGPLQLLVGRSGQAPLMKPISP